LATLCPAAFQEELPLEKAKIVGFDPQAAILLYEVLGVNLPNGCLSDQLCKGQGTKLFAGVNDVPIPIAR
jgi:hypothetical protein